MSTVLSPSFRSRTRPKSRSLLRWRASDLSLTARTGQTGVFARASDGDATAGNDVAYTAVTNQPCWHWVDTDGDGVRETPTLLLAPADGGSGRAADTLHFPFLALPREMTVYVRFVENGTAGIALARVLQIGDSADSLTFIVYAPSGEYSAFHNNGVSAVASTLTTAPSAGDVVELRATLRSDGKVQIHQSIDEAAEVSATESGALALPAAWNNTQLGVNQRGGSNVGDNLFTDIAVAAGVRTLEEMRTLL